MQILFGVRASWLLPEEQQAQTAKRPTKDKRNPNDFTTSLSPTTLQPTGGDKGTGGGQSDCKLYQTSEWTIEKLIKFCTMSVLPSSAETKEETAKKRLWTRKDRDTDMD